MRGRYLKIMNIVETWECREGFINVVLWLLAYIFVGCVVCVTSTPKPLFLIK